MAADLPPETQETGPVPSLYRRRGYRHTVSWAFYGAFFAIVIGQGPFVIRQLGGTALQSLMVNVGLAVPLVFAVLWVPFVERRNPVRLTGLLLGVAGVLLVFSGLASGLWSFVLVLAGGTMLAALSRPSLGAALRQVYPDRWRGKLLSLPNTASMLVRVVCLVLVGRLLRRDIGLYRWVFPAAGVCLVAGGLLFRGIGGSRGTRIEADGTDARSAARQMADGVRDAFGNRVLLIFLLGYSITACGGVLCGNALPLFARDDLALTTEQWGYASAGSMLAILVSFYAWGVLLDRFGAPFTMVLSWVFLCGMIGALYLVRSWSVFFLLMAGRGVFDAGNILAFFPVVMHFTDSDRTTSGMALHFTLWGIRWVLMILLVVLVVDAHLFAVRYLFLVSMALVAVGTAVMAAVWRCDRRRPTAGR